MARTILDRTLESRTARNRLGGYDGYYRRPLDPGLQLLYRRGPRGGAWTADMSPPGGKRVTAKLGTADDRGEPAWAMLPTNGSSPTSMTSAPC